MTPSDQTDHQAGKQAGDEGQRQPRISGAGIIVARPFGIPVQISPYWFIIAGVFIVLYANDLAGTLDGGTRYVVAAAFVVLLYLSVLVHELSHSVVARGYGLPVRRILLYPLGGVSEIEVEPQTPGREFTVSAAGLVTGLVAGRHACHMTDATCPGGPRGRGWPRGRGCERHGREMGHTVGPLP